MENIQNVLSENSQVVGQDVRYTPICVKRKTDTHLYACVVRA